MNTLKFNNPIVVGTLTSDPGTAENGTLYYNSSSGQFRSYQGGSWQNVSQASLANHNVFVGNGSSVATAVDTNSVGDILADSTNGFTIKTGVITNSEINGSAAISLTKLAALATHNRALQSDNSGFITESSVTSTELGYVSGVTSAIQTQLNGKLSLTGGTMSGNIAMGGNKLTGLGAGTGAGDSVRYEQAVLVTGVNAFTADQSMGGNKLTNLANGTASGDAVNYSQLTSISTGLVWQGPITDPDLVNDRLATPPGSPLYSILYIIGASGTGAWSGFDGHATWWDGTNWIDLSTGLPLGSGSPSAVQVGARFLIASATPGGPALVGGSFTNSNVGQIATVLTNTPGSFTWSFATPLNNWAVSDQTPGSQHYNNSFTYVTSGPYTFTVTSANATVGATYTNNGHTFTVESTISAGTSLLMVGDGPPTTSGILTKATGTGDSTIAFSSYTGSNWVDFAGPSKVNAGSALAYTGNTLNVQVDSTTIDISSNRLEVKTGGISNTQVNASAAIALTKLEALSSHNRALQSDGSGFISESSVTSTELGYVSGVTSAIQTQLNGKANTALSNLASTAVNVSINPGSDSSVSLGTTSLRYTNVAALNILSGASDLTLNANSGSNNVQLINSGFKRGASSSRFINETYVDSITLSGSSSGVAVASFTVAFGTIDCQEITYRIKDSVSNAIRVGTIRVSTDGTNTSITDMFTETADTGVTWAAAINGSNLEIRYTTTSGNKIMRADVKQFLL